MAKPKVKRLVQQQYTDGLPLTPGARIKLDFSVFADDDQLREGDLVKVINSVDVAHAELIRSLRQMLKESQP